MARGAPRPGADPGRRTCPATASPTRTAPTGGAAGPALARPPRRVELSLPEPLLRHFSLVDTPDTATLGAAGGRLLLDAVGRAGALLFVIAADQAFTAAELHLLAELARARCGVVFAVTPGAGGWAPRADGAATTEGTGASVPPVGARSRVDPVAVTVEAHRAALLAAVPALAGARWFPVDAAADAPADLRRALVGWAAARGAAAGQRRAAGAAGLSRAGSPWPPIRVAGPSGSTGRPAPVPSGSASTSPWSWRTSTSGCVQEIVFGVGCAGLPRSPRPGDGGVVAAGHRPVRPGGARASSTDAAARVLGAPPPEGVRRRIATAVQCGLADHRRGHELDKVLLVTSTAGVAGLTGPARSTRCQLPGGARDEVLPPVAVALSGGCWQHWRTPGNDDHSAARAWSQRAVREVELGLSREMSRRFEVIRLSLGGVLSDAVDHGILLA